MIRAEWFDELLGQSFADNLWQISQELEKLMHATDEAVAFIPAPIVLYIATEQDLERWDRNQLMF